MKNELVLDTLEVQELSNIEVEEIEGGKFWGPFLASWLVGEVIQGIYQAHQNNFKCKENDGW